MRYEIVNLNLLCSLFRGFVSTCFMLKKFLDGIINSIHLSSAVTYGVEIRTSRSWNVNCRWLCFVVWPPRI